MSNKTDREICDAATPGPWEIECMTDRDGEEYIEVSGNDYKIPMTPFDAEFIAHFNPSKVSEMLNALDAKDAEIERLRKLAYTPHSMTLYAMEDHSDPFRCFELRVIDVGVADHNCTVESKELDDAIAAKDAEIQRLIPYETDYLGVRSLCGLNQPGKEHESVANYIDTLHSEIERLKEDRDLAIEAIKKDFAQLQSRAIELELALSTKDTELAEERRLNAEYEAHFANTMHRHGVKEFRLETNGWQDILRKKEQGK